MRTSTDVQRYLDEHSVSYQDLGDGLFFVSDANAGIHGLAIKVEDEVVVFQIRVLDAPAPGTAGREQLFEQLLRLNGDGLLHTSFALLDDGIYLQAALPLLNLDPNELQAVLDDISLAVSQHVPNLKPRSNAN